MLRDLDHTFKEGKILLAHAPTGLGKTASALSAAIFHALEKNKRVFFLTNRHTQHLLAIDTLQQIQIRILGSKASGAQEGTSPLSGKKEITFSGVDLVGKRWMCSQEIASLFGNDFNEFCKTIVERSECEFYNNVRNKQQLTVGAKQALSELRQRGPLHYKEIHHLSQEQRLCSYEVSLALAKNAVVIVGDYNYLFNPFIRNNLFTKLDINVEDIILVVDEGHNLPARVTDMLSSSLTNIVIKNGVMEAKKFGFHGLLFWLQELMRVLTELGDFNVKDRPGNEAMKEKLVSKDQFISKVNAYVNYDEFINELELAAEEVRKKQKKSYLGGISSFLDVWKGEDKGFVRIISEVEGKYGSILVLNYMCLDPRIITEDIFKLVSAGVIMSGTLKPLFMYKDVLGIERAVQKEYGSPFPPENKLSLIIPETSTKYDLRGEAMYKRIAVICSELALLIPGNVAFFFPSYQLRDKIAEHFQSPKKLFWEKKEMAAEEKDLFLVQFKAEKENGGILLGVSGANFAEGVDLPGDLLNGVVVVGLPLARPDLKTKESIKYYEERFGKGWDYGYIYPAMSKCIQSAGRCIRSETDKGVVIFLDERFTWPNYFNWLPKEGLRVSKEYQKLLQDFFSR